MKTDEDVKDRLRRASGFVRPPDDPVERLYRRRTTKRRHDRLAAGGVALTLFVAAVGGSLYALRGSGHARRPVANGGSLALGDGQYSFIRRTLVVPSMAEFNDGGTVVIQTWWATDGSGRRTASNDGASYGLPSEGTWGAGDFPDIGDLSGLSTDPQTLLDQLRDRSAEGGASPQPDVTPTAGDQADETGGLWRTVKDLLGAPNATPELRAALVQAAELIPGVHRIDSVTDPVGREGYGLELDIESVSDRIDVDPVTLLPLAIESRLDGQQEAERLLGLPLGMPVTDGSEPSPRGRPSQRRAVIGLLMYEIYEEGIVDSTDAPPVGSQWLTPEPVTPVPTPGSWPDVSATAGPTP
jgi:hypothetical protein